MCEGFFTLHSESQHTGFGGAPEQKPLASILADLRGVAITAKLAMHHRYRQSTEQSFSYPLACQREWMDAEVDPHHHDLEGPIPRYAYFLSRSFERDGRT